MFGIIGLQTNVREELIMENPIFSAQNTNRSLTLGTPRESGQTKPKKNSFLNKVKESFFNHNGFELFQVKPQMPTAQISHFAKKAVRQHKPVAIQINEQDDIISEIIGYPSISEHSGQLVIQSIDRKVIYLITGSSIRHIRKA